MRTFLFTTALALAAILLLAMSCRRENNGDSIPTYLGRGQILHPPDTFRIMFRLNEYGSTSVNLRFEDSAVWHIARTAGQYTSTWVQRVYPDSVATITIVDTLQVALEAEVVYQFFARHSYATHRNIFLTFNRTALDFGNYPNRL